MSLNKSAVLTPATKTQLIEQLQQFLTYIQHQPAICDCRQCFNFTDGHCEKYDSSPPESFYLQDCENWQADVPF